jgi:hypothetical protein
MGDDSACLGTVCFPRITAAAIFAQEKFGKWKEFEESAFKRLDAA